MIELKQNPRLTAFLEALPRAGDEEFVNAPGIGTFRAKYVRRGMERGVLVVHWTGMGLAISQPDTHGACAFCKGHKGSQPCEHCACAMCTWFHQTDERASPKVSRAKFHELALRMQAFRFAEVPGVRLPALDGEIL